MLGCHKLMFLRLQLLILELRHLLGMLLIYGTCRSWTFIPARWAYRVPSPGIECFDTPMGICCSCDSGIAAPYFSLSCGCRSFANIFSCCLCTVYTVGAGHLCNSELSNIPRNLIGRPNELWEFTGGPHFTTSTTLVNLAPLRYRQNGSQYSC